MTLCECEANITTDFSHPILLFSAISWLKQICELCAVCFECVLACPGNALPSLFALLLTTVHALITMAVVFSND